jgi:tagatose 6-phosphate kinase
MNSNILTLGTTPAWQRTIGFDRFIIDSVNRSSDVHEYASGKSINVARVLHTMGARAVTTGFAGGVRGELMKRDLDTAGIAHDFQIVAAPTRQCITIIDRSARTATELVEESLPVGQSDWEGLDFRIRKLGEQCGCWIFSGSFPPQAPLDFYARFLPLAREVGATAIIDARGEPVRLALAHGGFVLKLNREELAATVGRSNGSESELRAALLDAVPRAGAAVVTLGASGSMASDGRTVWRISSPQVETVSAVGSGDAFAAGMVIGLSRGLTVPEACALGSACGAANALTPFAGHVDPVQVEQLRKDVRIELA